MRKPPHMRDMRIQDVIIGGFLVISCVPILATLLLTRYVAIDSLRAQIVSFSKRHIATTAQNVSYISQLYLNEVYQLAVDTQLHAALSGKIADSTVRAQTIGFALNSAWQRTPGSAYSLTLVDNDQKMYFHSAHRPITAQDQRYAIIGGAARAAVDSGKVTSSAAVYEGAALIVVSCPIQDFRKKEIYGAVVIALPTGLFPRDDPLESMSRYTDTFLVADSGVILNSASEAYLGAREKEAFAGKDVFTIRQPLDSPDWQVVGLLDERAIRRDVIGQNMLLLLCHLACILVYSLFVILFIKRVLVGFNQVADAMQAYEKQSLIPVLEHAPVRDLEIIYGGYNSMVEHIRRQDAQTDRLHRERIAALERLREAELKSLQLRINPHFLYNTLNTINCVAINNDDFEASNLIHSFSNILRYIVTDEKNTTLDKERTWLIDYLKLQQKRYSDAFRYALDFPPEIAGALIPKLVFQPFVENSILHGFRGKKSGAYLDISARRTGEALCLRVRDNGCGMSEERLRQIRRSLCAREDGREIGRGDLGMGLINTWYRLNIAYERRAAIEVNSRLAAGTEFIIRVPFTCEHSGGESVENCHR